MELCVSNVNGWRGACYGDSGGPAVVGSPGRWSLVGATSRGVEVPDFKCGISPAIYADVPAFKSWISSVVDGL